ncbi:MAG TPA: ABC transporter permease [Aggregatilineales bacterium]|nr:ABC transporter permease [Anaerolineales bacterium]HRE48283.1 ABC transporter permease [Aggregatilineales bacterium]
MDSVTPREIDYTAPLLSPNASRLKPNKGWAALRLAELWQYRELLYFLVWRDVVVRYKQTLLGVTWAVIQPFMTMVVFSLFFGGLAGVPSDGIPYPIFSFAALVPWTFFANGLGQASNSLVGSANLIKKVYFPRLIIPISGVLGGLPDFLIAFVVLIGLMIFYGLFPALGALIWLPALLILALITALGVGLWLSALNVYYRDVRYIVPFIIQLWMFATPIAYSSSLLPQPWRTLYAINPMVGVIDGFRWALLSGERGNPLTHIAEGVGFQWQTMSMASPPMGMILVSTGVALVILLSGIAYFRRVERTFADVV